MKRVLQLTLDALIFMGLFLACPLLLAQAIPGELAMVGYASPFAYAWWRGALPALQLRRVSILLIAGGLVFWARKFFALKPEQFQILLGAGIPAVLVVLEAAETLWRRHKLRLPPAPPSTRRYGQRSHVAFLRSGEDSLKW